MADLDSRKQQAETINQKLKVMNMVPAALFRDPKFEPYEYYQKIRAQQWKEAAEGPRSSHTAQEKERYKQKRSSM